MANNHIADAGKKVRLISLDEALKATHSEIYWTESQQAAVRSFLVQQPRVDAVEVVRCKDCRGWCRNVGLKDSPNGHCFTHDIDTNGFDFCSYGERRASGREEMQDQDHKGTLRTLPTV